MDLCLIVLRVGNAFKTCSQRLSTKSTMENTFLILAHAVSFSNLEFLTQNLPILDIQLVLVSKSDSACRETPKSVEFAFITY